MWQIDPDPQNMALLDAQPVGSIWPRAGQSVANDLLFLTEVGVRNLGTIGATANMAIGNTGQQVDPLVQAQLTSISNGTAPYALNVLDPYAANVSLLLHCDGANGSTSFPDSSPINNVFTITNAAVAVNTSNPEFGTGCALFTSASGGYMATPITTGSPLDLGLGDWTIELWLNFANQAAAGGVAHIIEIGTFSQPGEISLYVQNSGGQLDFAGPGGTISTSSYPTNTWFAWAVVCSNNVVSMFVNGVNQGATVTLSGRTSVGGGFFTIGGQHGTNNDPFNGFMDEIRITKGIARYSSNYTPATNAFGSVVTYDPFSLYYPGRGQYWLFFGAQAFVLTINGTGTKSWSRYVFPQVITDWTLNAGILYLRTINNLIWQFDQSTIGIDDSAAVTTAATPTPFNGVVQWPYLDLSSLGINKMLVGVDVVGEGNCSIQIAFNQNDKSTFNDSATFTTSTGVTTPYFVQIDDTVPGEPLAIPINAPSYSPILTFTGSSTTANAWTWQAMNIYFSPTPSNAGGAYG